MFSFDFSATARINALFIDGPGIFDEENQKVAVISQVSSPGELDLVQPDNAKTENIVIDFRGGWQVRQLNIAANAFTLKS